MVNYTVDSPSPLLHYVGTGWNPILPSSDDKYAYYNNQTAFATPQSNDQVNFTFYGNAIWLYGAKRGNHGQYGIALDNNTTWTGNGTAVPDAFQTLLYGISNLTSGSHSLALTNQPTGTDHTWVDVDYLVFADTLPDNTPTFFADNEGAGFEYFPDVSHWEAEHDNSAFGGSIWRTQSSAGSLKFTFNGEAVALYGRTGSSNAQYICSVDGVNVTLTSYSLLVADQQILCHANNLQKDVQHTFQVFNQPSDSKVWLEVDFARIWGDNARTVWLTPPHHPKLAIIAGVSGLALIVILLFAGITFFLIRRRRKRRLDRKAAYEQITLDDGEEWSMEAYRSEPYPGDALGVYSGLSNTNRGESSESPDPPSSSLRPPGDKYTSTMSATAHESYHDNTRRIRYESDAGPLMTDQGDDARTVTLPPQYSQVSSSYPAQLDAAAPSGGDMMATAGDRKR